MMNMVEIPKQWRAALSEISRRLRRDGKVTVFIHGEGPYCAGDGCKVWVDITMGQGYDRFHVTYVNRTRKFVDSNNPYGMDFINWLAKQIDSEMEVQDALHAPGRHAWKVVITATPSRIQE